MMIKILEKLGENKEILKILRSYGWNAPYANFAMQKTRGKLTSEVSLILWDYCNKHNIPVTIDDFKGD